MSSKAVATKVTMPDADALQKVLLQGDLSSLNVTQKMVYYNAVCQTVGLNPLTKPFDYIRLNGREVLYANKGCGEQLRRRYGISIEVVTRELKDGAYTVVVKATSKDKRTDSGLGAVAIDGLKGESLANAMMKAETKAKRRATLSLCGLNMLDETEAEDVKREQSRITPGDPGEGNGVYETAYRIPGGQYARYAIHEIDKKEMLDYIERISTRHSKGVSKKTEWWDDFVFRVTEYWADQENGEGDAA